jgi:hypothetical protein
VPLHFHGYDGLCGVATESLRRSARNISLTRRDSVGPVVVVRRPAYSQLLPRTISIWLGGKCSTLSDSSSDRLSLTEITEKAVVFELRT